MASFTALRGGFADFKAFFVHDVGGEGFGLHRREGSQADMQGDEVDFDAARADFVEQVLA